MNCFCHYFAVIFPLFSHYFAIILPSSFAIFFCHDFLHYFATLAAEPNVDLLLTRVNLIDWPLHTQYYNVYRQHKYRANTSDALLTDLQVSEK